MSSFFSVATLLNLVAKVLGNQFVRRSEVDDLVQQIKDFKAGAVDKALDRHIDEIYAKWKK